MNQKIYEDINAAIARGVAPHLLADELLKAGWPQKMVHDSSDKWLKEHSKQTKNDAFKEWIHKYHHKALRAVGLVVVLNVFGVAISLLKPWPTKILADSAFGTIPAPGPLEPYTNTPTLILITSAMTMALFIFGTLFGVIRDYLLLKIGYWLNKSIKQESMRHIMHLPLFHQERLSKGDYVYRQNVVTNSLSELVLGTTSSITESIIVIVGVIVIMSFFNIGLTIITIILIPFLFITMRLIGPKMGETARKLTEVASETSSRINEAVDNAETVQAFTLENKLLDKITRLWDKGYELSKRNLLWGELLSGVNGFLIVLATSLVMFLGGSAALRGEMTLGELLIFMTYMGYLLGPVETLVEQITTRNQKLIDVGRIYEVLADHEGIEYLRSENHMPPQIKGQIEFRNVSYSYNKQIIFKDLNLTIPPGQKVSIIGPSGGGKSTILKLIPLFLEPTAGNILIDNFDIESVSLKELRQHISWVSQTPQLFEGTIIDNLTNGDAYREVSNEEILNAIETANVTEFASKLPLGLASPAGENGGSLSGGQRQRVSIARALIKNSPIVCLDEPTAALDAKSENYIRDSLLEMIKGRTVLMVTHRKSLLALMDVVYVLDNGTLTDVNQLGGLDHYLAQLEGIEEQKAVVEVQKSEEREEADTEQLINDYEQFVETREPMSEAPVIKSPYANILPGKQQAVSTNPAPPQPEVEEIKPWQPNQTTETTYNPDDSANIPVPAEKEEAEDDVTINLH